MSREPYLGSQTFLEKLETENDVKNSIIHNLVTSKFSDSHAIWREVSNSASEMLKDELYSYNLVPFTRSEVIIFLNLYWLLIVQTGSNKD